MSKRDELIAIYAGDLKEKCGVTPDMDLLTKVTIGLGPAIYNPDSSVVSGTQDSEIETIRANFLIRRLGLKDGPELKGQAYANQLLVQDLMACVGTDREPMASGRECRAVLEMILATYASHLSGSKVVLPLADRAHPLGTL